MRRVATVGFLIVVFASMLVGPVGATHTINLSKNSGKSSNPALAVHGVTVLAAWEDTTPGNSEIFLAVSTDSGNNFGAPENVSQNSGESTCFDFVTLGRFYYFVWGDTTQGNVEIFFKRIDVLGQTAPILLNLSSSVATSLCPKIAVTGGNVYVAWSEDDIVKFRRSADGGGTFFAIQSLGCGPRVSEIVAFGPNVHVITSRGRHSSTDGGATIGTGGVCGIINPGDVEWQRTFVVGTTVYWISREKPAPGDNAEIYFRRGGPGLIPMPAILIGKQSAQGSEEATLLVSGPYVFAFWNWTANSPVLLYGWSIDGGDTWASSRITDTGPNVGQHRVALAGMSLFVVWEGFGGSNEIFYRRSVNIGATFGTILNLSNTTTNSRNPALVASGRDVMVAWEDNGVGGNKDIFFRRSAQGGF
jgi:hypothetical protein